MAIVLIGAKLGGHRAARLGQPPVLGERLVGVLLGNLDLAGVPLFDFIRDNSTIDVLASLGGLILLFEVGLESTVHETLQVGVPSLLVAVFGVVTPFGLGRGVGALMLPEQSA